MIGRDELEAIRLADLEGLYQEAAAERMGVSRQTFARILTRARTAVAEGLIEGKALVIEPGAAVDAPAPPATCPVHGGVRRRGRGCRCGRGPLCAGPNGVQQRGADGASRSPMPESRQACHRHGGAGRARREQPDTDG